MSHVAIDHLHEKKIYKKFMNQLTCNIFCVYILCIFKNKKLNDNNCNTVFTS